MYSSIETASLCTILEQSDNYSWIYLIAFQSIGGYRKCCHECSLGLCLVIDNFLHVPSDALPLYQILKQSEHICYGDIAFQRFGGYRKCRQEYSCSSARRVSNFNDNVPHGGINLKLYCNVFGIDNVMPL